MDTLLNIRAFIAVAECGTMLAASRHLNVAPSIISKRVARLEDELHAVLFKRTTRRVEITPAGMRLLPRLKAIVADLDDAVLGERLQKTQLTGYMRVKCPTTLGIAYIGPFVLDFQREHPDVIVDLVLLDRWASPLEEGFDMAIGRADISYSDVAEVALCENPLVMCASPQYLEKFGHPQHPNELSGHRCLNHRVTNKSWRFRSNGEDIVVDIDPCFITDDGTLLIYAAACHHGIAAVARYVAADALARGDVIEVMPDFPMKTTGLKAFIPNRKLADPVLAAFVDQLKRNFDVPPWNVARPPSWTYHEKRPDA